MAAPCLAECTLPKSILPPELAYDNILVMDGYEWDVAESRSGNTLTRNIARKNFEYPEEDAFITSDAAADIASLFFERNERVLGVPEELDVDAEEGVLPVPVDFVSAEKQYCEGLEVIGTVSGTVNIGGGDEYQVSSLIISWYVSAGLESLTPGIDKEEILEKNPGTDPELVILPTDDDFKLVWKIEDEDGTKLIDAKTGEETSAEKERIKALITKISAIVIMALLVTAIGYYFLRKKAK